ncbi:MAG: Uma2 family endonuclease [Pseudanabaenales cyanobacterium]|nr:Uma2 family endonuclease [Pseudanabaenales cyanobacterium]
MSLTAQELAGLMPDATQLESNEPEMESSLHYAQLALLVACLEWLWRERSDFFIGANLTIYFSREQLKNRDYRGPDFFLVNRTEKRPRRSWVVWEEGGQYPDLIIELLSDSTAKMDKTLKKALYQDRFRTPEYFLFSPDTLEFQGYHLVDRCYQSIAANSAGWLWSQVLGLYLGVQDGKLRYFMESGQLVPTPEEAAEQAQTAAQQAQIQAQQAEARAARLAEQLKALGVNPEI